MRSDRVDAEQEIKRALSEALRDRVDSLMVADARGGATGTTATTGTPLHRNDILRALSGLNLPKPSRERTLVELLPNTLLDVPVRMDLNYLRDRPTGNVVSIAVPRDTLEGWIEALKRLDVDYRVVTQLRDLA